MVISGGSVDKVMLWNTRCFRQLEKWSFLVVLCTLQSLISVLHGVWNAADLRNTATPLGLVCPVWCECQSVVLCRLQTDWPTAIVCCLKVCKLTVCHRLLTCGLQTDILSSSVGLWFANWQCHCLLPEGLQLTVCCHLLTQDLQTDSLSLLPEGLQSVFICWLRVCKLSVCHCLCAEGLLTGNLLSSVDGRFRMLSWRTLFRCLPIMGWRRRFALPLALPVVRTHFPITHLALLSNLLCAQVWVRCSWRDGNVTATLWDSLSSSFQACVV